MDIRKYFKMVLCASVLLFGACKDEDVVIEETFIDGVQKLKAVSQANGVLLSWENPQAWEYDRVEVSYTLNGEEKKITENMEEQYYSVDIALPDTEVYKFFVRAFSSVSQKSSATVSVKGRKLSPLTPEDELAGILNSVEVRGGDGGVRILWENPNNIQAIIRLEYEGQMHDIDAGSLLQEYSLRGLDLNTMYSFDVSIVYDGEVSTVTKTFTATALPAYRKFINDEDWGITASSTQAGLSAYDLLDDDPNTFWRSDIRITTASQYVIVDFKRDRYISALTFVRKLGDGENSSWDINISTSEDGVNYTVPYRYFTQAAQNPDPTSIFYAEFNRTIDGEQIYMFPQTHKARYVRVDFVRGSAFAIFGDINFYGE